MARGKKEGIAAKKKVQKVVLENPFEVHWPTLTYQNEQLLVEELQRLLAKEQTKNIKLERTEFVFGLNEVTRAVEKDDLAAVVIAGGVKPVHLVQHIVPLCTSRAIPVVCHRQLNTAIAKMINISSLVTLGIKRSAEESKSPLHDLLLLVRKIVPELPPHLQDMYGKAIVAAETAEEKAESRPKYPKDPDKETPKQKETAPSFLSLSTSSLVPLECPPPELDTLSIRIVDPNLELQVVPSGRGVKRKAQKKTKNTLTPAKIKSLQSSGKTKRTKKKQVKAKS